MITITIPKTEYKKLKQYSTAYLKIAEEITKAELFFPYDYKYIKNLTKQALKQFKEGKCIEAETVDEALIKFRKK